MTDFSRKLAEIIEAADRRHGDDASRALWALLEASNLPRSRTRVIHEKWTRVLGKQQRCGSPKDFVCGIPGERCTHPIGHAGPHSWTL